MYRDDRYYERDRGGNGYRDNRDRRRESEGGGDRGRDRGGERDIDRKRPRNSYDSYDNRGGGGGGGGGRGPPRYNDREQNRGNERYDEAADIESRLNSLIIRVGDKSTSSLEHNLDALASALETDIPQHRKGILDILLKCVMAQPVKTPVYGTLVGLINIKNFDFGAEVVEKATSLLELKLNDRDILSVKLLCRFLAELSNANVIQASSLLALFDTFMSICDEDIDPVVNPQDQTDFYALPIIASLPWGGAELARTKPDELDALMERLDKYMAKRTTRGVLFDPFEPPQNWPDRLDHVWKQVLAMRDDEWAITTTLRPYIHFESRLLTAQQHTLPVFKLPLHPDGPQQYPLPLPLFRIFDPSVSDQDVRGAERFVLEEYIIDLLYFFNSSHKDGVKFLTQLPVNFNIDYILVETIISQLFLLPKPPFKDVYYAVLFIDFFKIQQSIIPVFAEAVENLFNRLDEMDTECINRFSQWFSIHLSNFEYKWTWSNWDYILSDDALPTTTTSTSEDPQPQPAGEKGGNELRRRFVADVLERLVRLAYYERIRPTVPEDFVELLPSKPTPTYKYDDERISSENPDTEAGMLSRSLLSRIRMKETSEILLKYIDMEIAPKVTAEEKLEIVVQSLLQAGCKSFSHLLNTIERSIVLLNSLVKTAAHRHLVIESVAEFWGRSAQHITILLDKLMTYKVIDGAAIVNWLFDHERVNSFHSYVWEILTNTVNKTLARCETLTRELNSARDLATDKVRALEQVIEQAQREQKELFIVIFQRFATVISEYLRTHPAEGIWYRTILGYFKAIGRRYIEQIRPFIGVLETLLFANTEPSAGVSAVFAQIKLMCNTPSTREGSIKDEESEKRVKREDSPARENHEKFENRENSENPDNSIKAESLMKDEGNVKEESELKEEPADNDS